LEGLSRRPKSIPGKWLYDDAGLVLFEQIMRLPEYYPTRTEALILRQCAGEIAALAGPGARGIETEIGSGAIARTPLLRATDGRHVMFFPGTTIGNLAPDDLQALLARLARTAGPRGLLVLGADPTQDPSLLLPAYDDAQGVTAAFNKNLLLRMNRELGADFDPGTFRHAARYDTRQRRMEMHLVSRREQWVRVAGQRFHFEQGESIHTESSYKHGLARIEALAAGAGWVQRQLWTDACVRFGVHVFERAE
jgi:uncharacterized SAM-dependent methyltransferase